MLIWHLNKDEKFIIAKSVSIVGGWGKKRSNKHTEAEQKYE